MIRATLRCSSGPMMPSWNEETMMVAIATVQKPSGMGLAIGRSTMRKLDGLKATSGLTRGGGADGLGSDSSVIGLLDLVHPVAHHRPQRCRCRRGQRPIPL